MKKIPYLQWLILCDEYGKTEGTKKELIIGIFNKLTSTKFPFHYPKMWFLMKFTGCAGEYISSFSIKGPAGNLLFRSKKVKFNLKTETAHHGLNVSLMNFLFPEPGVYWFEVFLNSKIIAKMPLMVDLEEKVPEGKKH
ncbi:MAG: hypothetical protein KAS39_03755 [Actinomycetia bacterium]|nr:hypothetical protein [Actinomycetes bacterium]